MKLCSRFLIFFVEIYAKNAKIGIWSPFWKS